MPKHMTNLEEKDYKILLYLQANKPRVISFNELFNFKLTEEDFASFFRRIGNLKEKQLLTLNLNMFEHCYSITDKGEELLKNYIAKLNSLERIKFLEEVPLLNIKWRIKVTETFIASSILFVVLFFLSIKLISYLEIKSQLHFLLLIFFILVLITLGLGIIILGLNILKSAIQLLMITFLRSIVQKYKNVLGLLERYVISNDLSLGIVLFLIIYLTFALLEIQVTLGTLTLGGIIELVVILIKNRKSMFIWFSNYRKKIEKL